MSDNNVSTQDSTDTKGSLERGLKGRHISLIAIGGAIGTGLFYGSATTIQLAGPSDILAYLIGGILVYIIVRALGEMAVEDPVAGSFAAYAQKYLGNFAGFLTGWTYWFMWIVAGMCEITAIGIYVKYWVPGVPQWLPAFVALVIIATINCCNVKSFGEFEFWFATILVIAIIFMIVLGVVVLVFGLGHGATVTNLWTHKGFFPHGAYGLLAALVLVAYAYAGTELVGVTAGEAQDPGRTIPHAINQIVLRIFLFYVCSIGIIMMLSAWNKIGVQGSPFVIIFHNIGIPAASTILNAVVILAALSAFNSGLYSTGRMLLNLSENKQAPRVFQKLSKSHTPRIGILFSTSLIFIAVILNYFVPKEVFTYVSSIVVVAITIVWILILVTQFSFRRYRIRQGTDKAIAYRLFAWPVSTFIGLAALVLIIVMMGFSSGTRIALYVGPVWIVLIYLGYKMTTSITVERRTDTSSSGKYKVKE